MASQTGDRYAVWLSTTSLGVQPDGDSVIAFHFPLTSPALSSDGLRATYRGVFPGIDLTVYRNHAGFEYDWILRPGADPADIDVAFTGASYEAIDSNGNLILGADHGEVKHARPRAYQIIDGARRNVPASFDLTADGRLGFKIGAFDKHKPLIIDPSLSFASGLGGKGFIDSEFHPYLYTDFGSAMALDRAGNIYVAGLAYSIDFPLVNPLPLPPPPACAGFGCACPSAFVAKLSPDGGTILYSTFLAANCSSAAPSLAADADGNVYVAGTVQSGYPFVQTGGGTVSSKGPSDAFVAKLDANGQLAAAWTFGGSSNDGATSISLGPDGKLYVTGTTGSQDFPVTAGALKSALSSSSDLFLIKLDPSYLTGNQANPNAVLYSTYLGPGTSPVVVADSSGSAYVAASTTSTAWTTTAGVFQSQCWDAQRLSCADAIAMKVSPTGNQFAWATYFGGSGTDTIGGIALDSTGSVWLAGTTSSVDFPATSTAYQAPAAGVWSLGFVAKLSPDASQLLAATLLASPNTDTGTMSASAIAIDSSGNAWVGGYTNTAGLPAQNGIQQTVFNAVCGFFTPSGSTPTGQGYCQQAGYLAEVNPTASQLLWMTYLGGGNVSIGYPLDTIPAPSVGGIVFDSSGDVLVTGNQLGVVNTTAAPAATNSATVVKIAVDGTSLSNMAVASAADFVTGLPAPGGLAALFVTGIPFTGTPVASGLPLSTQLAGVTVTVNGVPCPILAVAAVPNSSNRVQVNFQVPFEIPNSASPQSYIVGVQFAGQSAFIVPQQAGPAIFTTAEGAGVIQHASDYSLVTPQNPVIRGETLIIYATGLGSVATPVASGTAASGPDPIAECNSTVASNAGDVLYAGLTPGYPGLYQINVQVSQYLPPSTNYIYLQERGCWFGPAGPQNAYQGNSVGVYVP